MDTRHRCRFCETHADAGGQKRPEAHVHGERRDDGEHRPQSDADSQHFLAAKPRGEPAGGDLHDRVAVEERRQRDTHVGIAPTIVVLYGQSGHRDVGAVHEAHYVCEEAKEQDDVPALAFRRRMPLRRVLFCTRHL